MVWHDHRAVQAAERADERKSPGQHDRFGTCADHAGRSLHHGYFQNSKRGGKVAGIARQALEAETGKPVITEKNAFDFQQLVTDIVEDAAELPENPTEKKDKD